MMPTPYRIVRSPMFTFLVGAEQIPMMIHTVLVAEQSPALESLVNGSMQEATSGAVIWEDVEEDTFGRFAQFVYAGDYDTPCHTTMEDHSQLPPLDKAEEQPDITSESTLLKGGCDVPDSIPKKSLKSKKALGFSELRYPGPTRPNPFNMRKQPRQNKSSKEDYRPIFLAHARLYVLGEKYGIKTLKAKVLQKLHLTLCHFTLYKACVGGVVDLIRYTYANTPSLRCMDQLRELVIHFVTDKSSDLVGSKKFLALVEEGGPFSRDLVALMLEKAAK